MINTSVVLGCHSGNLKQKARSRSYVGDYPFPKDENRRSISKNNFEKRNTTLTTGLLIMQNQTEVNS